MMEQEMKINIAERKKLVTEYPKQIPISGCSELIPGDQIAVKRKSNILEILDYFHHAIYIGDGQIVDFGVEKIDPDTNNYFFESLVTLRSYGEFHGPDPVFKVEHVEYKPLPNKEVVERSKIAVDTVRNYNRLFYNCEDFANQMKIGIAISFQVEKWVERGVDLYELIQELLSADDRARLKKLCEDEEQELKELQEKYGSAIQVYCHVLNPDFDKDEAMIAMADQVDPQGRSIDFVHDWFSRFEEHLAAKNNS